MAGTQRAALDDVLLAPAPLLRGCGSYPAVPLERHQAPWAQYLDARVQFAFGDLWDGRTVTAVYYDSQIS
jgi:hypothetical protein